MCPHLGTSLGFINCIMICINFLNKRVNLRTAVKPEEFLTLPFKEA